MNVAVFAATPASTHAQAHVLPKMLMQLAFIASAEISCWTELPIYVLAWQKRHT